MSFQPAKNRFNSVVAATKKLPTGLQTWALSKAIGSQVKLAGTAGCRIETLTHNHSIVSLKNRKKVQNHIGTIHACAMALIAESATGFVCGMNCPDDKVLVIKTMKIDFVKRATGNMKAEAHLTEEQQRMIADEEKGEVTVQVKITDEVNVEPIIAEMVWAWVPKRRK